MNDRLSMPSAMPVEMAELLSDNYRDQTRAEQLAIERRATELIAERLNDGAQFRDLMAGIEPSSYEPYLHSALLHVANAQAGDPIATKYALDYLKNVLLVINAEAITEWWGECEQIAERELGER